MVNGNWNDGSVYTVQLKKKSRLPQSLLLGKPHADKHVYDWQMYKNKKSKELWHKRSKQVAKTKGNILKNNTVKTNEKWFKVKRTSQVKPHISEKYGNNIHMQEQWLFTGQ